MRKAESAEGGVRKNSRKRRDEEGIDFRFGPITPLPFSPLPSSVRKGQRDLDPFGCSLCSSSLSFGSSCVRDNGISRCFIHKCDVTINRESEREREREARGPAARREGFKGRHSRRIRNRYEIWLCMNDVSRDHRYLQSLPASRSILPPRDEGMKGEAGMCSLFVRGYVSVYCVYIRISQFRDGKGGPG